MVHGIGVDILHLNQIACLAPHWEDPFFTGVYTAKELELGKASDNPVRWFAQRFAAKEAVFKSLGISGEPLRWTEIEVLPDETGKPVAALHGYVLEEYTRLGIGDIHISLSGDRDVAMASVICEKSGALPICLHS